MSRERRRHERHVIRIDEKAAFFRLHHNGKWRPLEGVHDVSVSGMGLRHSEAIDPDTPIKVSFTSRDLEVVLNARVRWCQSIPQDIAVTGELDVYRLGIEFDPQRMEDSMLMFMALRKYLDPFT